MNDTHVVVTTKLTAKGILDTRNVAGWTNATELDWFIRGQAPFLPVGDKDGEKHSFYFPRENVLMLEKTRGRELEEAGDWVKVSTLTLD